MKDTHVYKTALEEMLKNITEELKTIGIHKPSDWIAVPEDLDAEEPDLNLAADSVEEWNERSAIVATLETRYNGIVSALARIEAGTFGTCEVCGNEIEEKRLAVSPTARTCMQHLEDEASIA